MASGPASATIDPSDVQPDPIHPDDVEVDQPETSTLQGIGTSLKNLAKGLFSSATALSGGNDVMAPGQTPGAGMHALIDTESDQWKKAKAEFEKGNYGQALAHAIPVIGPALDKYQAGHPAEAITDVVAPLAAGGLSGAAEALPASAKAAIANAAIRGTGAITSGVSAAAPEVGEGLARAAAGTAAEEMGLPGAWWLGAGGATKIFNGLRSGVQAARANLNYDAANAAEVAAIPLVKQDAALDSIAKGLGEKKFSDLSPAMQDFARKVLAKDAERAAMPPPAAQPAPPPASRWTLPPSRQLPPGPPPPIITAAPEDTSGIIPGWQPTILGKEPVPAPAAPPPSVSAESPVDTSAVPVNEPPASFLDQETTGLQNQKVMSNRGAVADKLADHLFKNGITSDQIEALAESDPAAHKLLWNNLGRVEGVSKQAHYSPSLETQARTLFQLRQLERAAAPGAIPAVSPAMMDRLKSTGALDTAQQLRDALMGKK